MKRIACTMLIVVLVLFLAACSPREVLSAEEFTSRMSEAGHTVVDISHLFDDDPDAGVVTYLLADCGAFEVEFLVYVTEAWAQQAYSFIRRNLEDMRGSSSSHSEVNVSNFSRFRQTSDGHHGVVSRVDNTLVVVFTSSDNRAEVDAVLDILGY